MIGNTRLGRAELTVWVAALLMILVQVGHDLAQALQVWLG